MRLPVLSTLLFVSFSACLLTAQTAAPETQKFSPSPALSASPIAFTIKDIPANTKIVRVWFPQPRLINTRPCVC